jgi:hypothetical protein
VVASGAGISATTFTIPAIAAVGNFTLEMWCVRDGFESLYRQRFPFSVSGFYSTEDGLGYYATEDGAGFYSV